MMQSTLTVYPPRPTLVIDVSPLWELQYTGISNVVFELTRRFLRKRSSDFNILFTVFWKLIDNDIIEKCINERSGRELHERINANSGVKTLVLENGKTINGSLAYGLFLHRKPKDKVFYKDSYLFYDFSFLLAQECHTKETVDFHTDGLLEQIDSSDLFFTISESTKNDLQWLFGVPENKIVVALLGHNVDHKMATRALLKLGERQVEPYFLMLGTIEPRKNIALIFEWLSGNKKILNSFRFVFAGRQGWGPSFEDYLDKYNLREAFASKRIVHLGYVDEALKATLLVGSCAVLYPSIFEGFGLPVLEAMELGVPVIASCSTSIPEVLGSFGYYFDPYSVHSFELAFSKFLLDRATGKVDAVRENARMRAETFSYDKTFDVIVEALASNFLMKPPTSAVVPDAGEFAESARLEANALRDAKPVGQVEGTSVSALTEIVTFPALRSDAMGQIEARAAGKAGDNFVLAGTRPQKNRGSGSSKIKSRRRF